MYENKVRNYIEAYTILKSKTKGNSLAKKNSALIYAMQNRMPREENLNYLLADIKKKQGIFSSFRSEISPLLFAQIDIDNNIDEIDKIIYAYERLRKHFSSYSTLVFAAYLIKEKNEIEIDMFAEELKKLYKREKQNHPWITNYGDVATLALVMNSGIDLEKLYESYNECFEEIKNNSSIPSDIIQTCAMILSLGSEPDIEKVKKLCALDKELRNRKLKNGLFNYYYPLISIGSMCCNDINQYIDGIIDIENQLKNAPELHGIFGCILGKRERFIFASALACEGLNKEKLIVIVNAIVQIYAQESAACCYMAN